MTREENERRRKKFQQMIQHGLTWNGTNSWENKEIKKVELNEETNRLIIFHFTPFQCKPFCPIGKQLNRFPSFFVCYTFICSSINSIINCSLLDDIFGPKFRFFFSLFINELFLFSFPTQNWNFFLVQQKLMNTFFLQNRSD